MKYVFACVVALLVIAPVAAAGGHKASPPNHEYPKPPSNNPAPPPVIVPPPPPGHVCVPQNPDGSLGGKDGKPGNDDCARDVVPPPPSVTVTPPPVPSVLVPPVAPTVITKTVTVVKLVPAKPKPARVVVRWRTRFVVCPKNHVANKLRNACVPTGKQVTG